MKNNRTLWTILILCLMLGLGWVACGDDSFGGGGAGASCDFGDDCQSGLYCAYSFVTDTGECYEAPEGCSDPLTCEDCPGLYDPCENPNIGCSVPTDEQGNPTGNVTVSCN